MNGYSVSLENLVNLVSIFNTDKKGKIKLFAVTYDGEVNSRTLGQGCSNMASSSPVL
jgi:hypothetical protein